MQKLIITQYRRRTVGNETYEADVMKKDDAAQRYKNATDAGKSAGLVETR